MFAPLLRARCCAALRTTLRADAPARREHGRSCTLSRAMPERLRTKVRNWRVGRATVEPLVLAFRARVAIGMHPLLRVDAGTPRVMLEPVVSA
jgi:hypothetical protein